MERAVNHTNTTLMNPAKITPLYAQTQAKVGWILLWLLGVPLPVLLIIYLIKGG
jgi:hypothetical protein